MKIGQFDEISISNCVQSWEYVSSHNFNESFISFNMNGPGNVRKCLYIEDTGQFSGLSTSHDAIYPSRELCLKYDGIENNCYHTFLDTFHYDDVNTSDFVISARTGQVLHHVKMKYSHKCVTFNLKFKPVYKHVP
jgi:hypothetical protein